MGVAAGKWFSPDKQKKPGTTLVEIKVPHMRDAHDVIGLQPEDYTPVSIVPAAAATRLCGVPCCCVSVPAGFSAMVTRCGADVKGSEPDGSWSPGFHCFWPWYRVARLVSKQWIVFDSPVQGCRTQDNITVHIDVLIVFSIDRAADFVYGIGPEKLDDLLRATEEEVLKQMASEIPVEEIYDLQGNKTEHFVDEMNKKFSTYGVQIHHFTVRNVAIPHDMAQDFEDKTLYESKTLEKRVQQEWDRLDLAHNESKEKLREECDNQRMAAEEQEITTKAEITKEVKEVHATTNKEWKIMEAQRNADVMHVAVNAELQHAKVQAEVMTLRTETAAQIELEVGKLEAEAQAYESQKRSTAKMEATALIAHGKKAVAVAEGNAATAFSARRAQEKELKRLEILEKLGNNPGIKIITSLENNMGLAPDNSLVTQIAQQGMEAFRMKLAEMTSSSAQKLEMGKVFAGGLVRPVPQMTM